MSPKQWLALLCVYISYLFFGASIFYYIEHTTELGNRAALLEKRIAVNGKKQIDWMPEIISNDSDFRCLILLRTSRKICIAGRHTNSE